MAVAGGERRRLGGLYNGGFCVCGYFNFIYNFLVGEKKSVFI